MVDLASPRSWQIGFQVVCSLGLGILYATTMFPVTAPIPITGTAHALALFTFVRSIAQTFSVTIGATILQNGLKKKLPAAFLAEYSSQGVQIAYSVIPVIPTLEESLRGQVRDAFADSLRVIWRVMIGISAVGLLCVLGMKEVKMHEVTDTDWGMTENRTLAEQEEKI